MSGAQNWSVKGIDPKVREAAREAAARQGMSLGEYLNQALASGQLGGGGAQSQSQHTPQQPSRAPRPRAFGTQHTDYDGEDDWGVNGGASRTSDPTRLAQRIESIERRTQLAVTGLDRAVSTIDRSVLGLAARIEDAEAASSEAAERISDALEQFRAAGETLSGRAADVEDVKHRLEHQVAVAEEVARRAEAAASFLTNEMSNGGNILAQTLAEARTVAEEAARQATEASIDAVTELRRLQEQLSERLSDSEASTRRAIESAVAEVRTETSSETRGAREALLEEVVRLEGEISKRVGAVDTLKAEQATLIGRIERAEAGARESTAGLRQAAGAAIADLRNAQLTLSARVKQVEDIAGGSGGGVDLTDVRQAQQDIAERLGALESKTDASPLTGALAAFEARIASVEAATANSSTAKIDQIGETVESLDRALQRLNDKLEETESTANTAIRHIEETVSSLGARIEQGGGASMETEAVRAMLEQRLDTMAQSVREEITQELHAVLAGEEGVEGALTDVNKRLAAAERRQAQTIEAISIEIKRMSETVDQRLRTVEARNDDAAASAVREELTRMSATLEQRFDDIERREAAAFDRMGLEVGRLSERLEERVGAVEQRSAQAIEHVGEQVARMADRFNQRQDILARELGERMLDSEERAGQRVSEAISSIMQRLAEVEEHSQEAIAPVQKAVSDVASKLEEFETGRATPAAETPAPTMRIPTPARRTEDTTNAFDRSAFPSFEETETSFDLSDPEPAPYSQTPRDAAQPVRAAPLPPRAINEVPNDHDIYFAEDNQIDDLLVDDDAVEEAFVPPEYQSIEVSPDDDLLIDDPALKEVETVAAPPIDDDPFWTPDDELAPHSIEDAVAPLVAPAPQNNANVPLANSIEEAPLSLELPELTDLPPLPEDPAAAPARNDYLANARKAAQAQSLPKTRPETPKEAPKLSLRGSSRVVLWGAASAIAAALIGGAYYMRSQGDDAQADAEPPLPVSNIAPTLQPPADPFAEAPTEGVAPDEAPAVEGAAPTAAPAGAPVAQTTQTPATQQVVAGPLPARNVSLEQAAQSGDLTAQYELALQRIASGRTAEGVTMLRRAADRGFPMAQYRLAKLYERGEGVPADLTIARQWTERSAGAGNRRAMHDLGVYFARGEGAPLDEAAAFRWFRQAAELGVADSQYNLGVLYQQGRGVNASASEALFWFMVAARQGDQDAGARATALEAQLTPQQVEQARARAQAFRPRASSATANGEFGVRAWNSRPST
ncbi:MAG: SEL1-like repeat protein [Caulobacteraceae bacterium]|nr:SEL1-like repeat protein [Caulobacteraceae bacterium]